MIKRRTSLQTAFLPSGESFKGKYTLEEAMKWRAFRLLKQLYTTAQSLSNKQAEMEICVR